MAISKAVRTSVEQILSIVVGEAVVREVVVIVTELRVFAYDRGEQGRLTEDRIGFFGRNEEG